MEQPGNRAGRNRGAELMLKRMLWQAPMAALMGALALVGGQGVALAESGLGQSLPGQMGLQEAATEVARDIHSFYDFTNIIIIAIAVFVLILMLWAMYAFSEKRNPTPSATTHNTVLEVAWTVIPIFILVAIAIPSFKLLMLQYTYPKPDLTIKAVGNAWFWEHQYPDQGNFVVTSNMLTDKAVMEQKLGKDEYKKRYSGLDGTALTTALYDDSQTVWTELKKPRQLAVDNEIVVPVNKVVHVLTTSNDVIHNWTIPSFGSKLDAVPGRLSATWFRAEKEGMFYGQCSELCGMNHAYMPIAVRVVSEAVFNDWAGAMKAKDKKKAREILDKVAGGQDGLKTVATAAH